MALNFTDHASEAIRDAGGRFTGQRRIIVELLESAGGHIDADQLYRLAHERDASISLATVYRTLNVLQDAGLIDRRYLTHGHERKVYEPAGAGEHYHFTCRVCGRVIEFESEQVAALKTTLETSYGVRIDHACLCFEGVCSDCREKTA
jgi:Fur family ferric uptake transcriptional regulator